MSSTRSPPTSTSPCKAECKHLIALANALAAVLKTSSFPGTWRARADALLRSTHLETLEGEQALEHLALDLRRRWLHETHSGSGAYMMSPPHGQKKHLPNTARIGYPYDRWLKPRWLELRLNAHRPAPEGWASRSLLFANGMAAITTVLQVYRAFAPRMWPKDGGKKPLSLHWFGGYFEIIKALQLICDNRFQGRKHVQQRTLHDVVEHGNADVILIEPVAADFDLEVFDLEAFIAAWKRRRTKRPCTIIVDASLSGSTFPLETLCKELHADPPALVIHIRSGLKLDQEGLELANVGLLTIWAPDHDGPDSLERLDQVEHSLQVARTTLGASLSQDEYAALSASFFLDRQSLTNHASAVFDNNRKLAHTLAKALKQKDGKQTGGLLTHVAHPCLAPGSDRSWAEAPFVNIGYRPDNASSRAFLRAVLEFEASTRKLCLQSGSSFGFRAHRFEMGFARGLKHKTLRVAMGARKGPSCDGVIALFEELAAYPDFAALRKAYPQIASQKPKDRTQEET